MNKSQKKVLGAGALTAAALAVAAGAYFLSGEKGKTRKAKLKEWGMRARKEIIKNVRLAKHLSESQYKTIVDQAVKHYGSLEDVTAGDIVRVGRELKAEWDRIKTHAEKLGTEGDSGKSSRTAKSRSTARKTTTKRTRRTSSR